MASSRRRRKKKRADPDLSNEINGLPIIIWSKQENMPFAPSKTFLHSSKSRKMHRQDEHLSMRILCCLICHRKGGVALRQPSCHWSNSMASVHVTRPSSFIVVMSFVFLIISTMSYAAEDSEALSRLKISITNAGALQSWKPGTNPCDEKRPWEGVLCNRGSVMGIRLERKNLSGTIDIDALLQIAGLRTVSFISNSFSGPIPAFNRLIPLRSLYLSSNQFSGEIPADYFAEMKYMKKLWLSSNKFTGAIPSSLGQLPLLMGLHLENNKFTGNIPQLQQKSLVDINVSNNNLMGEIPSGLSKFDASSFKGNPGLCGDKIGKPCQDQEPKKDDDDDDIGHKLIAVWIILGCIVLLGLMIAGILCLRRRQERIPETDKETISDSEVVIESGTSPVVTDIATVPPAVQRGNSKGSGRRGGSKRGIGDLVVVNDKNGDFGLPDLMKAAAEVLGNGPLGSSYKAMMTNGLTVMVKRIKEMNKIGKEAFDAEIRRFALLNHRNILAPLAYHYRKEEKLLVSEYIPRGSLLYIMHGDRGSPNVELKWPVRLKIIKGIARGLGYLHTELSYMGVPHGNLKSSNVLLSPDYEPLLSDYGLVGFINSNQAAQALFAYKAPEAMQQHHITAKCDVYCMGVIILELLTGKFPSQYLNSGSGGTDIVQWARSAIAEGREAELFDPGMASSNSSSSLEEMEALLHIGAACTEQDPENRPDVREAIRRIEEIQVVEEAGEGRRQFQESPSNINNTGIEEAPR